MNLEVEVGRPARGVARVADESDHRPGADARAVGGDGGEPQEMRVVEEVARAVAQPEPPAADVVPADREQHAVRDGHDRRAARREDVDAVVPADVAARGSPTVAERGVREDGKHVRAAGERRRAVIGRRTAARAAVRVCGGRRRGRLLVGLGARPRGLRRRCGRRGCRGGARRARRVIRRRDGLDRLRRGRLGGRSPRSPSSRSWSQTSSCRRSPAAFAWGRRTAAEHSPARVRRGTPRLHPRSPPVGRPPRRSRCDAGARAGNHTNMPCAARQYLRK